MMRLFLRRAVVAAFTAAAMIACASSAQAITLGQLDDFDDGVFAGWDAAGQVTYTSVTDAGPLGVGDDVLNAEFINRFTFFNQMQWTGNYIAAGVTKISMDVWHQNAFPLTLRLGIANGVFQQGGRGDTYVTIAGIAVPSDGQWHRITFGVAPADFTPSLENPPPSDAAAALTNVTHLRILHNETPGDFLGESIAGSLRVNNIRAEGATDADFDGDYDVDGNDFLIWQRGLGVGATQPAGDADFNGSVNALDLAVWKGQFGMGSAMPAAAAIPEPAAVALAALASFASTLVLRRRKAKIGVYG